MKKTSVIIGSLIMVIIILLVVILIMTLDNKSSKLDNTTTTTKSFGEEMPSSEEITTLSTTSATTTTSTTTTTTGETTTIPAGYISSTAKTKKTKKTTTTTTETTTTTTRITDISEIKCDDNNRVAWSNVLFSIEDGKLYVYLNDYEHKYLTTYNNLDCMAFKRLPQSSFGSVYVYRGANLVKEFNYSQFNTYTEDNLGTLVGNYTVVQN